MKDIKYFGHFHSVGSRNDGWSDTREAYTSLKDAMEALRRRYTRDFDWVTTYQENPEGVFEHVETDVRYSFPSTQKGDIIDLYIAVPDNAVVEDGYLEGDWAYRISVGPRGGIRAEKA